MQRLIEGESLYFRTIHDTTSYCEIIWLFFTFLPFSSILISQFAFFELDPFYFVFGVGANLALMPARAVIHALTFAVAAILLRIGEFTVKTIIYRGILVAGLVIYSIVLDPIWTLLAYTMAFISLAVIVWEYGFKGATAARCLTGLLALGIVIALGPGRFLLAMSTNTSRYLEPELNSYPGLPVFTSTIYPSTPKQNMSIWY